jgi:hypothetical protein
MQAHVKRAFNLQTGSYAYYDFGQTLLPIGPGCVEVPDDVAEHWYFQANIRSGNITIIEQNDAAPVAA